jgi:hypothetical protein
MKYLFIIIALCTLSCDKKEEPEPTPPAPETTFQGRVELTSRTYFTEAIYGGNTVNFFDYPNYVSDPNLDATGEGWKWVDTLTFNKGQNYVIETTSEQSAPPTFSSSNTIFIKVFNNTTGIIVKDTVINDPSWNTTGSTLLYNSQATFRVD